VDASQIKDAQEAVEQLKETMKGNDTDAIKKASEKLSEALYTVSAALYAKTEQEQKAESDGPQGDASDDNVVDADYKVEDDKK
jgi:molecular chaperone DnaK